MCFTLMKLIKINNIKENFWAEKTLSGEEVNTEME